MRFSDAAFSNAPQKNGVNVTSQTIYNVNINR